MTTGCDGRIKERLVRQLGTAHPLLFRPRGPVRWSWEIAIGAEIALASGRSWSIGYSREILELVIGGEPIALEQVSRQAVFNQLL